MPFNTAMQDLAPGNALPAAEMDKIRENLLYLGSPDHQIIAPASSYAISNTSWADFQPGTFTLTVSPTVGLVVVGFSSTLIGGSAAGTTYGTFAIAGTPTGNQWQRYTNGSTYQLGFGDVRPFFLSPGSHQVRLKILVSTGNAYVYYPTFWAWWV